MSALISVVIGHLQLTSLYARLELPFPPVVHACLSWGDRIFNVQAIDSVAQRIHDSLLSFDKNVHAFDRLVDNAFIGAAVPLLVALAERTGILSVTGNERNPG